MKTIRISEDVWAEIKKRGEFGETVDDVLRRVFHISEPSQSSSKPPGNRGTRRATLRMSSFVDGRQLFIRFVDGHENSWMLPDVSDKNEIRRIRDDAVEWAREHEASEGQMAAVKKALTEAGYHLIR